LAGESYIPAKRLWLPTRGARKQGLNDAHFDTFLEHFRDALEEVGVKPDKSEKVMKLLESKRTTVLNR
jgi:truncated hemoglobin YjbI